MKRTRLIITLVAVILIGGLVAVIIHAREPRYQGRTLTEWVWTASQAKDRWFAKLSVTGNIVIAPRQENAPDWRDTPDWRDASRAVKAMTPAAIPIFLRWASAKDSPRIVKAKEALNEFFGWHLEPQSAMTANVKAYMGFELLGGDAKPAWKTLIQRTASSDPYLRRTALVCLAASRPPDEILRPILLLLKQDPDATTAMVAGVLDQERFLVRPNR